MLKIAIIDDDIEDLVRVVGSFVTICERSRDFQMFPILLSDPEVDTDEAISSWCEDTKAPLLKAGLNLDAWPTIQQMGKLDPSNTHDRTQILEYLSELNVNVILSDSWIGPNSLAGLRLLDSAEKEARWAGNCWLMTRHPDGVLGSLVESNEWRSDSFYPLDKNKPRFIYKKRITDLEPGESSPLLQRVIEQGIAYLKLEEETELPAEIVREGKFGSLIGNSPLMLDVYKTISQIAETDAAVWVFGETGTGKELIAREIHARSRRAAKPFVPVNCAAIPSELVESYFFGHDKYSFAGANTAKKGYFREADNGTLFLDEIGDLSPNAQVKLLRAIDSGQVRPVGRDHDVSVNVRIIAATNKDIPQMVEDGSFRKDLRARFGRLSIDAPPLRDRSDDIPLLVTYFARRFNEEYRSLNRTLDAWTDEAMGVLKSYHWPENVRELEKIIEMFFSRWENKPVLDCESPAIQVLHATKVHVTANEFALSSTSSRKYKTPTDAHVAIETGLDVRTLDQWAIELGFPETFDMIEMVRAKRSGHHPSNEEAQRLFGMTSGAWRAWIFRNKDKGRNNANSR